MTSFIIINFNTNELTKKCVDSIIKHLPEGSFEIIVVDNDSMKADKERLKEELYGYSEMTRPVETLF